MDVVRHRPNQGWIEVITGSMFSGKSEELIRRLRRAQIARRKVTGVSAATLYIDAPPRTPELP